MQVSFLVNKIKEESKEGTEGVTRKRLQSKIASLAQHQVRRVTDALVMIWNCAGGSLEPITTQSKATFSAAPPLFPNWHHVKVALLKSITTGVFIDAQFYAYNKILDGIPLDPRPLFTSSIVIEEWGPSIATRKPKDLLIWFHPNTRSKRPQG